MNKLSKIKAKRWWLYVLKLEEDKWYVGITAQTPEKRMKQHVNKFGGARWTEIYKPIKIHDTEFLGDVSVEKALDYEGRVTRKYMEKYGDNNVRGGDLTDVENYVRKFHYFYLEKDWRNIRIGSFLVLILWLVIVLQALLYQIK